MNLVSIVVSIIEYLTTLVEINASNGNYVHSIAYNTSAKISLSVAFLAKSLMLQDQDVRLFQKN